MTLKANVAKTNFGLIVLESSTVGSGNIRLLQGLMQEALFEALPAIDTYLATKTFVLPGNMLSDVVSVSAPSVSFHDGFVELGLTPEFSKTCDCSNGCCIFGNFEQELFLKATPVYDYSKYE